MSNSHMWSESLHEEKRTPSKYFLFNYQQRWFLIIQSSQKLDDMSRLCRILCCVSEHNGLMLKVVLFLFERLFPTRSCLRRHDSSLYIPFANVSRKKKKLISVRWLKKKQNQILNENYNYNFSTKNGMIVSPHEILLKFSLSEHFTPLNFGCQKHI